MRMMNGTETTVEKRKHNRFRAQEETYVALMNDAIQVGQIINISKGGLAFNYIGEKAKNVDWLKMDIFLSGNRFRLKEVPFKAVSDFSLNSKTPFSTVSMRQCGGRFGQLTQNQASQLDYLIANHTKDSL